MRRRNDILLGVLALAGLPLLSAAARTADPPQAIATPDAQRVLADVRRALGFTALVELSPGVAITDARADGQTATTLIATRRGAFAIPDEAGFDGFYRWRVDSRRGVAPDSLRQHEKTAWPIWVRGHWWLDPASGVTATILPAETDASHIALMLRRPGGVVPATVYIDRATMLPDRLVVPYDRGPFEARYGDWRQVGGVLFAHRVTSKYRDETVVTARSIVRLTGAPFAAPALPADAVFDPAVPALVPVKRGPDFGSGQRGHVFVPARVDGADAGWWLLDSGADGMLIDEKIADRLGMPVLGETRSVGADGQAKKATWRRGKTFTVGRLTFRDPLFRAIDLSDSNAPPGERRSGVIGYDMFARAVVEYARDGDRIAVCDPARYRLPAPGRWQPLDFIDATPAVAARFEDNRLGLFQIDTGAAGSVDFYKQFVEAQRLLEGRATREVTSSGSGGAFTMRAGILRSIDLGGVRFRDREVGFRGTIGRDGAGVIGRELFEPFLIAFDYPHRRIAFVRDPGSGTPAARCR